MNDTQWEAVLDYIDDQVEQTLTVAQIAAVAGYSAFHFNRLFGLRMSVSVMEYIRMRKLQFATVQVIEGQRVLDIALRYGFSSHEGFTRAFKRLYGTTPQRFRLLHCGPYHIPPRQARSHIRQGGTPMEPRKENWKDRVLIAYRLHTQPGSAEIPAFWNEVMGDDRWGRLIEKSGEHALNYGVCLHPEGMPDGQMDYLIAFDYDGTSQVDPDMELYPLQAATYMAFPVAMEEGEAFAPAIARCWSWIYTEWFPGSGMAYDGDKPDFEVYYREGGVDIFIPLQMK